MAVAQGSELSTIRAENERLKNQLQDYRDGMTKVAKSAGLITPLELIMRAKNNEQTYFDIFAEMLATEYANPEQLRALRAEREELVGVLREWLTVIKPDGELPTEAGCMVNIQRQLEVEAKAAALIARLEKKGEPR